ncbi:thiopeptide-type bacteriocin biosynthesis protein [Chryseobacterium sp. PTM-20240506]|nr:thiopeptide-type bacteriocin biosynthesis protein [Chryseobacterium sp. CKR4-1]MDQ1806491.1 thiopeptide-type bacteriocin biosynthesis protein [Chryseobacterium sp. CKR4-1]
METETIRKFTPGNEWIYFKIYTGIKTADYILDEAIKPLADYLLQSNIISKWFFIRYHDPQSHIRVRLKLNSAGGYDEILKKINKSLEDYTVSGEISNILIDTYSREIERYGEHTIEDAETLFSFNSSLVLDCLYMDDEEKILLSLFHIDKTLDMLHLSIEEKLSWLKDYNYAFKKEFNSDKSLNSQLDKKYREIKPRLIDYFLSDNYRTIRNRIVYSITNSRQVFDNINQSIEFKGQSFFQSIFHMNINRLFASDQRIFEMIIYDYLHRYYKSILFTNRPN